jgi:protease-4
MDELAIRKLADGRAYTGRQALGLGLVDAIGGEDDARAWLAAEKGVPAELPARDVAPESSFAARVLGASLGFDLDLMQKILLSQGLTLDGAWALWQPARQ